MKLQKEKRATQQVALTAYLLVGKLSISYTFRHYQQSHNQRMHRRLVPAAKKRGYPQEGNPFSLPFGPKT
jgi:hypothetical protein